MWSRDQRYQEDTSGYRKGWPGTGHPKGYPRSAPGSLAPEQFRIAYATAEQEADRLNQSPAGISAQAAVGYGKGGGKQAVVEIAAKSSEEKTAQ